MAALPHRSGLRDGGGCGGAPRSGPRGAVRGLGRRWRRRAVQLRPPHRPFRGAAMLLLCAGRAGCGLRAVRAVLRSCRNGGSALRSAPRPAPLLVPAGLALGCVGAALGAAVRCQESDVRAAPTAAAPAAVPAAPRPEAEFQWAAFWALLRPQLLALSAAVVLALGAALLNVRIPVLLGQLVDVVAREARTHLEGYLRAARPPALRLLGLYSLQALLTFGYIALLSRVGEQVAASMRKALFVSLLRQDVAFFDAHRTGQLVARLTADVQEFKSSFKLVISQGLRSSTQAAGCVLSLYLLSPRLTALLLLVLPALVSAGAALGSVLRALSRRAQEQVAKATGVADEVLGNVRTVRAFAMEEQQAGLYCAEAERSSGMSQRLGLGIAAFQGLSNLALNGIVLGTIFVGGSLMAGDQLSPGDLMSFLVASQTVQRSLANISILFGQVVRGLSAGARVFEFMTLEPQVPLRGGDTIPSHSLLGHVAFRHVSFSYPTRPGHPVLQDFSLMVPPGETVAIVGPSGGGKSTVAALLERFYEPTHGTITLDGRDIASLDPSWLRGSVIGFISQEPVLFGTTIMENIRFGKPGASDEEVFAAARLADADAFIRAFPDGYGTVVGERGAALSGGQRQRVALARALLKAPAVLVLDEATSALDAEAERAVQAALERAARGRTVLLIAHRLSTVRGANRIVVLAGGRVAEVGTHEELLRRGGLYAQLMRQQAEERRGAE
ncbi:mitochondrial potassium channel ATP-binding subunit isoform X1 [Gallus gallus]|uniref:mitochondrial potassium channel ATP-binding subunit isoform X1 n=1 Tax=Gallus gallus TaxID=9031 RepID=UPI001AEB5D5B|nr:mitochondrial potassium channel ATP-binding subunit isoform X1 [Gallus gallus]